MEVSREGNTLAGYPMHSSIEVPSPEGPRVIAIIMGCDEAPANAALLLASRTMLIAMRGSLLTLEPSHLDCDVMGELCVVRMSNEHRVIRLLRFAMAEATGDTEYIEEVAAQLAVEIAEAAE